MQVALTSCAHHQLRAFINTSYTAFSCNPPGSQCRHVLIEFGLPYNYDGHELAMRLVPEIMKCSAKPFELELYTSSGNLEAGILAYGNSLRIICIRRNWEADMMELVRYLSQGPVMTSCPNVEVLRLDAEPSSGSEKLISDLKLARPMIEVVIGSAWNGKNR